MIIRFFIIIIITALSYSPTVFAQQQDPASQLRQLFNVAQAQMQKNDYEAANKTFRQILSLKTKIPADVSYLFAETLYMIGQYKNSRNFVEKYIELTGRGGEYYTKAVELQDLLDEKMSVNKTCVLCDVNGYVKQTCEQCNGKGTEIRACNTCKGRGHVMCQLCAGEGVRITRNAFGERNYESCTRCASKGYHDCPVCDGEKLVEAYCTECSGLGSLSTNKICTHPQTESMDNQ